MNILFCLAWPEPCCLPLESEVAWTLPVMDRCEPLERSRVQSCKEEWMNACWVAKEEGSIFQGLCWSQPYLLSQSLCGKSWGILINLLPFILYEDEEGPSLIPFKLSKTTKNSGIYPSMLQAPFCSLEVVGKYRGSSCCRAGAPHLTSSEQGNQRVTIPPTPNPLLHMRGWAAGLFLKGG